MAPSPAHAYRTLADLEGTTEQIAWASVPVVSLDADSFPVGLRETIAVELAHAVRTWNDVECTGPLLAIDHGHPAAEVQIRYEPEWFTAGFDPTAAASTDVVVETASTGGARIVQATVHVNGRMRWAGYGQANRRDDRDARVVLVHELGHVLGLAHNCEPDAPGHACDDTHVGIVMHPVYGQGGGVHLATDDVEGICALYASRVEDPMLCDRTAECYEGEFCQDGECAVDRAYGAACAQRSDCRTTYCIADSVSPAGGICTRMCDSDAECPSGAECVMVEETMGLQVCRPRGPTGGCRVAHGAARPPLLPLVLLPLAAILLRRRSG